jgi:hypothetical protein
VKATALGIAYKVAAALGAVDGAEVLGTEICLLSARPVANVRFLRELVKSSMSSLVLGLRFAPDVSASLGVDSIFSQTASFVDVELSEMQVIARQKLAPGGLQCWRICTSSERFAA